MSVAFRLVVDLTLVQAFIGREDLLDYTSTKGAIVSFSRGLSNQLVGSKKIRSNAIAPGPGSHTTVFFVCVGSPLSTVWTPLVPSTFSRDNLKAFNGTPMGRPSQPVEIATVCVFLASQDSSAISGQVIHPNAGTVIS
jgi:NAD(P)-dependent dehydrogenase (short-subunit alcohol dehydrogenase family)